MTRRNLTVIPGPPICKQSYCSHVCCIVTSWSRKRSSNRATLPFPSSTPPPPPLPQPPPSPSTFAPALALPHLVYYPFSSPKYFCLFKVSNALFRCFASRTHFHVTSILVPSRPLASFQCTKMMTNSKLEHCCGSSSMAFPGGQPVSSSLRISYSVQNGFQLRRTRYLSCFLTTTTAIVPSKGT